jgi:hypothetical protein
MPCVSCFCLVFTGVVRNISRSMQASINDGYKIFQTSTEACVLFLLGVHGGGLTLF